MRARGSSSPSNPAERAFSRLGWGFLKREHLQRRHGGNHHTLSMPSENARSSARPTPRSPVALLAYDGSFHTTHRQEGEIMKPISIGSLQEALSEQSANTAGILKTVAGLQSLVMAQQAALYSLIATHPNPRGLFDEFASYLDRAAPEDGEELDDQIREALQRLQEKIRQAASRSPT